MGVRSSEAAGTCTISIDVRTASENEHQSQRARWNRIEDIAVLLTLLRELCGPDAQVFFDFGVISVKDVDLSLIRERFNK